MSGAARVCQSCGRREDQHNVRHPFVALTLKEAPKMVPMGWIAVDIATSIPTAAGYQGAAKLYRSEAIAKNAIGKRRMGRLKAIPVFASPADF